MTSPDINWSTTATVVTALATIVLAYVTTVLARETKRLSDATSQPSVVVTFEPSPWSIIHTNLVLENTGTGTAYDIEVTFNPPLRLEQQGEAATMPLRSLSVLKPGSSFSVFLNGFENLSEQVVSVDVRWRRSPDARKVEGHSYVLNLVEDYKDWGQLGGPPPMIQIAQDMRKLREEVVKLVGKT